MSQALVPQTTSLPRQGALQQSPLVPQTPLGQLSSAEQLIATGRLASGNGTIDPVPASSPAS
jgi:hypothetical protein